MPSISNYLDATQILVVAIVDTADWWHRQQSCHTSATTLAINAIIEIDCQHCQPGCRASAPAINAIVDIDRQHHCQQNRRALSSAPALAINAIVDSVKKLPRIRSRSPLQLPPTDNSDVSRSWRIIKQLIGRLTINSILFLGSWHDDDDSWTIEMNED
jgi:hypothetical protein